MISGTVPLNTTAFGEQALIANHFMQDSLGTCTR